MKKTIAQTRIDEMTAKGYKLAGRTTGLYSFRKGSNLSRTLESLGLTQADVEVLTGAHLQRGTEGWQLLIFVRA
jgi:hypothetical protein